MMLVHFSTSCFKLIIMVLHQGWVNLLERPFVLAGIVRDAYLPIFARLPR
jgi:hypothetical protein